MSRKSCKMSVINEKTGVQKMPEYDNVYFSVYKTFILAYMLVCEWQFGEEQVAQEIEDKTIALLKEHGDAPIRMLLDRVKIVTRKVTNGEPIEGQEEFIAINRMVRECTGHRRYMSIAVEAYKACVILVVNGGDKDLTSGTVIREFINRILDAEFFKRHPLGAHHGGVSTEDFEMRLRKVRVCLEPYIEDKVVQIVKSERVDKLRKMPQKRASSPDFSLMDISMSDNS